MKHESKACTACRFHVRADDAPWHRCTNATAVLSMVTSTMNGLADGQRASVIISGNPDVAPELVLESDQSNAPPERIQPTPLSCDQARRMDSPCGPHGALWAAVKEAP